MAGTITLQLDGNPVRIRWNRDNPPTDADVNAIRDDYRKQMSGRGDFSGAKASGTTEAKLPGFRINEAPAKRTRPQPALAPKKRTFPGLPAEPTVKDVLTPKKRDFAKEFPKQTPEQAQNEQAYKAARSVAVSKGLKPPARPTNQTEMRDVLTFIRTGNEQQDVTEEQQAAALAPKGNSFQANDPMAGRSIEDAQAAMTQKVMRSLGMDENNVLGQMVAGWIPSLMAETAVLGDEKRTLGQKAGAAANLALNTVVGPEIVAGKALSRLAGTLKTMGKAEASAVLEGLSKPLQTFLKSQKVDDGAARSFGKKLLAADDKGTLIGPGRALEPPKAAPPQPRGVVSELLGISEELPKPRADAPNVPTKPVNASISPVTDNPEVAQNWLKLTKDGIAERGLVPDENGFITLYHATSKANARKIETQGFNPSTYFGDSLEDVKRYGRPHKQTTILTVKVHPSEVVYSGGGVFTTQKNRLPFRSSVQNAPAPPPLTLHTNPEPSQVAGASQLGKDSIPKELRHKIYSASDEELMKVHESIRSNQDYAPVQSLIETRLRSSNRQPTADWVRTNLDGVPPTMPLEEQLRMSIEGATARQRDPLAADASTAATDPDFYSEGAGGGAPRKDTAGETIVKVLNLPKAVKSSLDISAPGRQGWILSLANPGKAARAFGHQMKALASESSATARDATLRAMPEQAIRDRGGLYLAEMTEDITKGEEAFVGNVGGQKWVKLNPFRRSEHAYVTYLNEIRASVYDRMAKAMGEAATDEDLQLLANYVNVATGRGGSSLKPLKFNEAAPFLNSLFFSPKLATSRFEYLVGQPLVKDAFKKGVKPSLKARRMIAGEYAKFLAGISGVLYLAKANGAGVNTDMASSDFGKIKIGDTRIDVLAGLSQPLVLMNRLATGRYVSAKGNETDMTKGKYGSMDSSKVMVNYARSKASPSVGAAWNMLDRKDFMGKPYSVSRLPVDLFAPITPQDIYEELTREQGFDKESALVLLNLIGFGVQRHNQEEPKRDRP